MPLEVILPKIDSIEIEADLLYRYVKAEKEAALHIVQSPQKNLLGVETFTYQRSDSLTTLFIQDSTVVGEVTKDFALLNLNSSKRLRPLNATEKKLFHIRQKSLRLMQDADSLVEPKEGFHYTYAFWPEGEHYKLYALITPAAENSLTFTDASLFMLNSKVEVLSRHDFEHPKPYYRINNTTSADQTVGVFLRIDAPYIYATDVCLFRLYKEHTTLEELNVLSKDNKRSFTYRGQGTEIEIQQ
ncbi:MAG: hypothetical protein CMO34_05235 [Verrucomicrobia bacterium]|nr:hypothetical protein [Verrucomicrobiota bacterium]